MAVSLRLLLLFRHNTNSEIEEEEEAVVSEDTETSTPSSQPEPERQNPISPFLTLPPELHHSISHHLDFSSVINLMLTSSRVNGLYIYKIHKELKRIALRKITPESAIIKLHTRNHSGDYWYGRGRVPRRNLEPSKIVFFPNREVYGGLAPKARIETVKTLFSFLGWGPRGCEVAYVLYEFYRNLKYGLDKSRLEVWRFLVENRRLYVPYMVEQGYDNILQAKCLAILLLNDQIAALEIARSCGVEFTPYYADLIFKRGNSIYCVLVSYGSQETLEYLHRILKADSAWEGRIVEAGMLDEAIYWAILDPEFVVFHYNVGWYFDPGMISLQWIEFDALEVVRQRTEKLNFFLMEGASINCPGVRRAVRDWFQSLPTRGLPKKFAARRQSSLKFTYIFLMVQMLVSRGIDPTAVFENSDIDGKWGMLEMAINPPHPSIAGIYTPEQFLETALKFFSNDSIINRTTKLSNGNTALHKVVGFYFTPPKTSPDEDGRIVDEPHPPSFFLFVIQKLIQHGANPRIRNHFGVSPLYLAAGYRSSEVLRLLLPTTPIAAINKYITRPPHPRHSWSSTPDIYSKVSFNCSSITTTQAATKLLFGLLENHHMGVHSIQGDDALGKLLHLLREKKDFVDIHAVDERGFSPVMVAAAKGDRVSLNVMIRKQNRLHGIKGRQCRNEKARCKGCKEVCMWMEDDEFWKLRVPGYTKEEVWGVYRDEWEIEWDVESGIEACRFEAHGE